MQQKGGEAGSVFHTAITQQWWRAAWEMVEGYANKVGGAQGWCGAAWGEWKSSEAVLRGPGWEVQGGSGSGHEQGPGQTVNQLGSVESHEP